MNLYRGSRQKVDILEPQPIPEGDKGRYPAGVEEVVFATPSSTEAQIYAVFSQRHLGSFAFGEDDDGVWRVNIPVPREMVILDPNEKVYIYEVSSDGFQRPLEGDEYYCTDPVSPIDVVDTTVSELMEEWDREGSVVVTYGGMSEGEAPQG